MQVWTMLRVAHHLLLSQILLRLIASTQSTEWSHLHFGAQLDWWNCRSPAATQTNTLIRLDPDDEHFLDQGGMQW
jgi:hypothetical protein